MRAGALIWFRLRFPRDLELEAVQAALAAISGMPHGARVVLELTGDHQGIHHRLGVSRSHADLVTGGLTAAIGSLRLDLGDASPAPRFQARALWQLTPHVAALRIDDSAGSAAALLASLLPLGKQEAVQLVWSLSPGPRPPLAISTDDRASGRVLALKQKLARPGLHGVGELRVAAPKVARRRQLMQRVGSALWSLSTPFGRLVPDSPPIGTVLRGLGLRGHYLSIDELVAVIGWPIGGPVLPGLELGAARRLAPSRELPRYGRVLGVSDYGQGSGRPVALTAKASSRGLYILGPTGTGKTSLIKNLVRDDLEAGHGLAVVETNGDLITDLLDIIPAKRQRDVVLLDPTDRTHAVGLNPFVGSDDYALVADQLGELFQRLWKDYWGPRTGQLAHMGLMTLAQREGSTLLDLPRLYLDSRFRAGVLKDLDDPVGLEPDWSWFAQLAEREQATVVAPLLNKVRQFTARPAVRAIMGQPAPAISMRRVIAERKILLVNLPKGLIGAETATLLGCLVLIGLWQAITERARLRPDERRPFFLAIDEVQDLASAPIPFGEMLSQGRKYGLSLTVAHQNLDQLPKELREAILANARSRAVFSLSTSDARALAPSFDPWLTAADLQALDAHHIAALVALDSGGTARPVTLATPKPPTSLDSATRVREQSRRQFARPRSAVEAALREQVTGPASPVGRRVRGQP